VAPEYRDLTVAVDVAGLSYGEAARALRLREGTGHKPPVPRQHPAWNPTSREHARVTVAQPRDHRPATVGELKEIHERVHADATGASERTVGRSRQRFPAGEGCIALGAKQSSLVTASET
jgi:hypothetical protein